MVQRYKKIAILLHFTEICRKMVRARRGDGGYRWRTSKNWSVGWRLSSSRGSLTCGSPGCRLRTLHTWSFWQLAGVEPCDKEPAFCVEHGLCKGAYGSSDFSQANLVQELGDLGTNTRGATENPLQRLPASHPILPATETAKFYLGAGNIDSRLESELVCPQLDTRLQNTREARACMWSPWDFPGDSQ